MTNMKSFDRTANSDNPVAMYAHMRQGEVKIRCVPWPEDAPDPSTVPHAGERVVYTSFLATTGSPTVFTVVNGIPRRSADDVWRLRISSDGYNRNADLRDIEPYVEAEEERTYTEAEIRTVVDIRYGSYFTDGFIEDLRRV